MYRGDVNDGKRENDEKWAVFIQILQFFHQSALISQGKHCLLSRHDYFDYCYGIGITYHTLMLIR